jgi:hypothetical protein
MRAKASTARTGVLTGPRHPACHACSGVKRHHRHRLRAPFKAVSMVTSQDVVHMLRPTEVKKPWVTMPAAQTARRSQAGPVPSGASCA